MPSAFGRGQCLDCPSKAAPPSDRCEACQIRLAQAVHEPMSQEALQQLKNSLAPALARLSGPRRQDVAHRLERLYALVQEGRLDQQTQAQLLGVAQAVSAGDGREVSRLCALLTAQHWGQHRDWIVGLKRLAAA